jgi:hypothetical protein
MDITEAKLHAMGMVIYRGMVKAGPVEPAPACFKQGL